MKKCCYCKKYLKEELFSKNKASVDGLQSGCKKCRYDVHKIWAKTPNGKFYKSRSNKKTYTKNRVEIIKYTNKYNNTRDSGFHAKYWNMKRRCEYPSQDCYKWYGGKGIIVEWKSYKDFKEDMYKSYLLHLKKHGHKQTTIDRIDSSKNYCKENCRWTTYLGQAESKRNIF